MKNNNRLSEHFAAIEREKNGLKDMSVVDIKKKIKFLLEKASTVCDEIKILVTEVKDREKTYED